MIKVNDLHNSYIKGKEILKGVDLEVDKGEVIAIVGPSGSGKTTLLRCISFLEKPSKGVMKFAEKSYDMGHITKKEIRQLRLHMGFVFQGFNLFRNMTVMENIMEPLVAVRKIDKSIAEKRAIEVLEKVGMYEWKDRYPDELSGGQQQRVAIARAVAPNPSVILFDEPTSALDPELTLEVLDTIRMMAKAGTTMVLVTHEMGFAREIATKVIFMEDGRIVEQGSAREIFDNPKLERTKQFMGNRGIK